MVQPNSARKVQKVMKASERTTAHKSRAQIAAALAEAVQRVQDEHQIFPLSPQQASGPAHPLTVVVGVSGGADSLCLLHLLCALAKGWPLALHVAHLDHALRADSAHDAHFVAAVARQWGLPFHGRRLQPGELAANTGNLEAAARQLRHTYLMELAQRLTPAGQTPIVALAHHADDQAETVLHHLIRGSGLQGLTGMRPLLARQFTATDSGTSTVAESVATVIHFVRPLLYVRRATILRYLDAHELTWREDVTNQDQQLTRNYLRHTILPALAAVNPATVDAIGRLATVAHDELARLQTHDRQLLNILRLSTTQEVAARIVLDLDRLRTLPTTTQRAVLRLALMTLQNSVPQNSVPQNSVPQNNVPQNSVHEITLAQLNKLVAQVQQPISSGPHPLWGDLAWSVIGASGEAPTRLSLHRASVLALSAAQPLLANGQVLALPMPDLGRALQVELDATWRIALRQIGRGELPADWRSRDQPWRVFLDADQVGCPQLATPCPGQRFMPLGMAGQHKQVGDFFTDHKVPVAMRSRWPLLIDGQRGAVLWICGLRVAHPARITSTTVQVLAVHFEPTAQQATPVLVVSAAGREEN